MRTIEITARKLSANARSSMRYCAMQYRAARKRGDVGFQIRWLIHAQLYRTLARGYLEAA